MVAEKRTVWCSAAIVARIRSISSINPMFSISSASSRITVFVSFKPDCPAVHMVHQPSRRGHDNLRTFSQRLHLAADILTAVNRQGVGSCELRDPVQLLRHLDGQLAGRSQHDPLNRCRTLSDLFEQRNAESGRFPVPVWACPTRSRPARRTGIVCSWIGVGSSNPISFSALIILSPIPNALNLSKLSSSLSYVGVH